MTTSRGSDGRRGSSCHVMDDTSRAALGAMAAPGRRAPDRLLVALCLVSAAVTAQQIALMQVLGWMHWHHFAYMIVAIALLGFGVAGTTLSLARERLLCQWGEIVPWLLLGCAFT